MPRLKLVAMLICSLPLIASDDPTYGDSDLPPDRRTILSSIDTRQTETAATLKRNAIDAQRREKQRALEAEVLRRKLVKLRTFAGQLRRLAAEGQSVPRNTPASVEEHQRELKRLSESMKRESQLLKEFIEEVESSLRVEDLKLPPDLNMVL